MWFQGLFGFTSASSVSLQPILGLHIPDGFLSLPVSLFGWIVAIGLTAVSLKRVESVYGDRTVSLMGEGRITKLMANFRFDIDSQKSTFWHSLAPRTRVLCVCLWVLAIAFTPNAHWWSWATYGATIFGLGLISRVTWSALLKRLAVEFSFIGTVLVGTLFQGGGDVAP